MGREGGKTLCHRLHHRTPSPLPAPARQPPDPSLKADCEELNCFHMSSARAQRLWPLASPAAPSCGCYLCVPRASASSPRVHTRVCARGIRARPPPCRRSRHALAGGDANSEQCPSPPCLRSALTTNHVKQYTTEKNANKLKSA